jgi:16S rRNA processing protein RimM
VDRPEWIEVGRLARPHGVRGELRIVTSSDNPERFLPGSVVSARPDKPGLALPSVEDRRMQLTIESVRGDDNLPIVAFREVTSREEAAVLNGYVLEVRASDLPDLADGEYYPFDLIGLEARTPDGVVVGSVIDIVDSPAHELLVISLSARSDAATEQPEADARPHEVLVPFVEAAVPIVAPAEGFLVVDPRFLAGASEE